MAEVTGLIEMSAEALHERATYIVKNAHAIYASVRIGDRWEDYPLSELRGSMAISEAFRLLLRAEEPARVPAICAHCDRGILDAGTHVCET